jgi:SagB-type dehydrogenase family enzyme
VPAPPLERPCPPDAKVCHLVPPEGTGLGALTLLDAIQGRRSLRRFGERPLSLEELSFLLWATQGVQEVSPDGVWSRRVVPSGGSRHPLDTYLAVNRVTGLEPGIYRYLPVEHSLCYLHQVADLPARLSEASLDQRFVGKAAVVFIWVAVPYRCEWRYAMIAHKVVALDAGHICQNLYLACTAIGAGTCAIGAYDQAKADTLLGLDGEDEFVTYVAPVGKPPA